MNSSANQAPSRVTYPSGVDWWLATLLIFPIVAAITLGIALIQMNRPGDSWVLFGVAVFAGLLTACFTIPCRYTLLEDAVSVRCGLICYQIPYHSIRGVEKSRTLLSGPALSLRRVIVQTTIKQHILSPADRDGFMEQLKKRCLPS